MNYVRAQSIGGLVKSSYAMLRYLPTFIWVVILMVLPGAMGIIATDVTHRHRGLGKWVRIVCWIIAGIPLALVSMYFILPLLLAASTVIVSDVCME